MCIYNADLVAASKMKLRLDNAFDKFNDNFEKDYEVSASFGYAEFNYNDIKSIDELIELADKNMYIEKEKHKINRK